MRFNKIGRSGGDKHFKISGVERIFNKTSEGDVTAVVIFTILICFYLQKCNFLQVVFLWQNQVNQKTETIPSARYFMLYTSVYNITVQKHAFLLHLSIKKNIYFDYLF